MQLKEALRENPLSKENQIRVWKPEEKEQIKKSIYAKFDKLAHQLIFAEQNALKNEESRTNSAYSTTFGQNKTVLTISNMGCYVFFKITVN